MKVFVSKSHATNSYSGGDSAAIWVESVDNKEFTVCVLEYGDGSSGTTKVNWMALQSVPVGAQLDTVSLDSWTTGEKCKRIAFEKVNIYTSLKRFTHPYFLLIFALKNLVRKSIFRFLLFVHGQVYNNRSIYKFCV